MCRELKRHRIDVLMDFTSEEGLQEAMSTLSEGSEAASNLHQRHRRGADVSTSMERLQSFRRRQALMYHHF
jgi:hypothetical protein